MAVLMLPIIDSLSRCWLVYNGRAVGTISLVLVVANGELANF